MVRHCGDTLQLGTAGILDGSALQGYSAVGHCRDTGWALQGYWVGTAGILGGWALRILCGWALRILCGWALQGYLVVGHCRDTLRLGTAWILCGWALQQYVAIEHCSQAPGGGRGLNDLCLGLLFKLHLDCGQWM